MESNNEGIWLVKILTEKQGISYEVLKYYGQAHIWVDLMDQLWWDTRRFWVKMKETGFFDDIMDTIKIGFHQCWFLILGIKEDNENEWWEIEEISEINWKVLKNVSQFYYNRLKWK